jgi:hypothetical protein
LKRPPSSRLLKRIFRLNPRYRLLRLSSASGDLRELAHRLSADPELYGLLLPEAGGGLATKAVNRDVWDLLAALRTPAPALTVARSSADYRRFLTKQLIDGVLEVSGERGFVSGIEGLRLLMPVRKNEFSGHPLQRLSRRAVEIAYLSGENGLNPLACRLYFHNRLPVTREWVDRFPDESAILKFLKLRADGTWPGMPSAVRPVAIHSREADPAKRYWRCWDISGAPRLKPGMQTVFKVYLCARPESADILLHHALRSLPGSGASRLKIPRTAQGLLRPDKFVAYFSKRRDAEAYGRRVATDARGVSAQATPFTAPLDDNGIASMGADPPAFVEAMPWQERSSWRFWVSQRLSRAILNVRRSKSSDPVNDVLAAVRSSGVDPDVWLPEGWDFSE